MPFATAQPLFPRVAAPVSYASYRQLAAHETLLQMEEAQREWEAELVEDHGPSALNFDNSLRWVRLGRRFAKCAQEAAADAERSAPSLAEDMVQALNLTTTENAIVEAAVRYELAGGDLAVARKAGA